MKTNNHTNLAVGDWVRGKTRNGELIHGYLVNLEPNHSKAKLKVVVSDNEQIVGRTVRLEKNLIERIDRTFEYTQGQLENLIDLALLSKDEDWFMELTTELKNRQDKEKSQIVQVNQNRDYHKARDL